MADQPIHFNDGDVYERTMGVWSQLAGEQFLDPSEAQLAFARDRAAARGANFLQEDALALPFPNDRFDAAVMALVIFFLPDPAKGVAEMARVVRPSGTVAAYAWDMLGGGFPWEPIHAAMREMGITPLLPPAVNASRLDALRDLWGTAGIEATELRTLTVQRTFVSFGEFWATTTLAASLQPTLAPMAPDAIERLKAQVRSRLPTNAAGHVIYPARANAIMGRVPL